MGKEKKAKKSLDTRVERPAVEKNAIKASLKALKAERDTAEGEHDKKKLKAVRAKMKRVNLKLKKVKAIPEPPKEKAAAEPAAS